LLYHKKNLACKDKQQMIIKGRYLRLSRCFLILNRTIERVLSILFSIRILTHFFFNVEMMKKK
jgi:hypothetical protein